MNIINLETLINVISIENSSRKLLGKAIPQIMSFRFEKQGVEWCFLVWEFLKPLYSVSLFLVGLTCHLCSSLKFIFAQSGNFGVRTSEKRKRFKTCTVFVCINVDLYMRNNFFWTTFLYKNPSCNFLLFNLEYISKEKQSVLLDK